MNSLTHFDLFDHERLPPEYVHGKQKLIDKNIQMSLHEMPKVNEFVKTLPKFPRYKLADILLDPHYMKQEEEDECNQISPTVSKSGTLVVNGWLYMGDHSHCKSEKTLKK